MMGAGYGVFSGSTNIMEEWFNNESSKIDSDNIPTSSQPETNQKTVKISREVKKDLWMKQLLQVL
jgi:hypothetical protein